MAKQSAKAAQTSGPAAEPADKDKAKATKWFEHGKSVADTHNYDYAIECYINGLGVWPEAVDEGHKPLRAVAFARLGAGKKKPGMLEKLKFDTGGAGRVPLAAMLAAEKMLAKDPTNLNYMEAVVKNAAKGGYEQTCLWLGPIFAEGALSNIKANSGKLATIRQVYEDLGDVFNQRGDIPNAVICFDLAGKAADALGRLKPDDGTTQDQLRNLAGKLTITKGKFEGGDFRDSLHDAQKQRELHDHDRMVQDDSRLDELIKAGLEELQANPNEPGKVYAIVDLMLRKGTKTDEAAAIQLLVDTYERSHVYQFKNRADEIRMRQMHNQARAIRSSGDRKAAAEHLKKMLAFEIEVYKERVRQYPTEARHKYELGKRYFMAQQYDEAVPVLQLARSDPKNRYPCISLIAQSFFRKGYYDQSINVLIDAIKTYEVEGDDISKDLHYWLGRSQEDAGQKDEAARTYGQIIQWDYNYRDGDVRQRLEAIQKGRQSE